jgi:hypothetical protein
MRRAAKKTSSCIDLTSLADDEDEEAPLQTAKAKSSTTPHFELEVQGEWNEVSSGGNVSHASWRHNPQYNLRVDNEGLDAYAHGAARVVITLSQEQQSDGGEPVKIGFYVCRRQGVAGCDHMRLVTYSHENFLSVSQFSSEEPVSCEVTLPASRGMPPYVIMPVCFEPGGQARFRLHIKATLPVKLTALDQPEHIWANAACSGAWAEAATPFDKGGSVLTNRVNTAGGCRHHITWRNNPQFMLYTKEAATVIIVLSQEEVVGRRLPEIGFYIAAKATGSHVRKMIMNNNDIIAKTLFQPRKETTLEVTVPPSTRGYRIIPTTHIPGQFNNFTVNVWADKPLSLVPVEEDWSSLVVENTWSPEWVREENGTRTGLRTGSRLTLAALEEKEGDADPDREDSGVLGSIETSAAATPRGVSPIPKRLRARRHPRGSPTGSSPRRPVRLELSKPPPLPSLLSDADDGAFEDRQTTHVSRAPASAFRVHEHAHNIFKLNFRACSTPSVSAVICIFHVGHSDLKTQGFHVLRVEAAPEESEEEDLEGEGFWYSGVSAPITKESEKEGGDEVVYASRVITTPFSQKWEISCKVLAIQPDATYLVIPAFIPNRGSRTGMSVSGDEEGGYRLGVFCNDPHAQVELSPHPAKGALDLRTAGSGDAIEVATAMLRKEEEEEKQEAQKDFEQEEEEEEEGAPARVGQEEERVGQLGLGVLVAALLGGLSLAALSFYTLLFLKRRVVRLFLLYLRIRRVLRREQALLSQYFS